MKQIARLIKQFQLKSKIFHFDYAHRGSNTHKHQLYKKKKKRRTKYHMCVWLAIDLCTFAYQKLNAVKSLAHSNCISCHLVEIAWLLLLLLLILLHSDPPARSSGNGCVHIAGSPDLRYTRLLAVTLSCLAVWGGSHGYMEHAKLPVCQPHYVGVSMGVCVSTGRPNGINFNTNTKTGIKLRPVTVTWHTVSKYEQ